MPATLGPGLWREVGLGGGRRGAALILAKAAFTHARTGEPGAA